MTLEQDASPYRVQLFQRRKIHFFYDDVEEEVEMLKTVIASVDEVVRSNGVDVINVSLESMEDFCGMFR